MSKCVDVHAFEGFTPSATLAWRVDPTRCAEAGARIGSGSSRQRWPVSLVAEREFFIDNLLVRIGAEAGARIGLWPRKGGSDEARSSSSFL